MLHKLLKLFTSPKCHPFSSQNSPFTKCSAKPFTKPLNKFSKDVWSITEVFEKKRKLIFYSEANTAPPLVHLVVKNVKLYMRILLISIWYPIITLHVCSVPAWCMVGVEKRCYNTYDYTCCPMHKVKTPIIYMHNHILVL